MSTSLALNSGWDLFVSPEGNIATVAGIAAQVQDVACACRLFLGELWYDTTVGVPWLQRVLGKFPVPMSFISAQLQAAALSVPGVATATPNLTLIGRELSGTITITNQQGQSATLTVSGGNQLPWYVNAYDPNDPGC